MFLTWLFKLLIKIIYGLLNFYNALKHALNPIPKLKITVHLENKQMYSRFLKFHTKIIYKTYMNTNFMQNTIQRQSI